jgi:iron complex outermembrane receptor protein
MRIERLLLVVGRVALLLSAPGLQFVSAQDLTGLSLDQLGHIEVVTASKFPQKVSEAPSSVIVVTAEDIENHGYRTLADLLRSMRGVIVTHDRNYSYLGTRGSGRPGELNSRILLLVDGQRLNDQIYDQASIGTEFPIDMELIERVEYVPGPGSAIYGSSAFFGVINVITKQGRAIEGVRASVQAGGYRTGKAGLIVGQRLGNGDDLLLSASGFDGAGKNRYFREFDDAASNHGVAVGTDYDRYQRLFAKYTHADVTLAVVFGERTKGIPTAAYGQQFNDPRSLSVDRYFSTSIAYQRALSPTLDVSANLGFTQYRYTGDAVFLLEPATLNRDLGDSATVRADLRLLSKGYRKHKLIYGIELFDAVRRSQRNIDLVPHALNLDANHPKQGYALYGQDEFRLSDSLIINAGLRHDHDSEGGNADNPRLGLIWKVTPDLTSKLLLGTAFRLPNAYERYYADSSNGYKSVAGLMPERIRTRELVLDYFPRPDFKGSISLFAYQLRDLITLATDPVDGLLFYTNADAASSRGVELDADHLGPDGSRLKGSISLQSARSDIDGAWLSNSPHTLVKFNYSRPLSDPGARIGLEMQYTSRRKTVLGGEVGGFTVVNLTLARLTLAPRLDLSASIYNLLARQYADPPGKEHFDNSTPPRHLQSIGQDGRIWRIALRYQF